MAIGPAGGRVNRPVSRSRVDWSAQWMSSRITSSGVSAASWASPAYTASNRSARPRCSDVRLVQHPVAGHQPGEGRLLGDQPVGEQRLVAGDRAEQLAERQVGQRAVAEVEAVTDDHPPAGRTGQPAQLAEQPGLAQAGVTGEQDRGAGGRHLSGAPTSPISRLSESSSWARPTSGLRGSGSGGTTPIIGVETDIAVVDHRRFRRVDQADVRVGRLRASIAVPRLEPGRRRSRRRASGDPALAHRQVLGVVREVRVGPAALGVLVGAGQVALVLLVDLQVHVRVRVHLVLLSLRTASWSTR